MAFTLAPASSMTRVSRDKPFCGSPGQPLELAAAMNGWASGQVVISAEQRRLRAVHVEVSALSSLEVGAEPGPDLLYGVASGPQITPEAWRVSRVHYVPLAQPGPGSIAATGWYPDPLEPLDDDHGFEVEAGASQPIWLSLKVPPEETTPRHRSLQQRFYKNFKGEVVVTAQVEGGGEVTQRLEVHLRVFKFRLPQRRILRIWTLLDHSWDEFYNWMEPRERFEALERAAYLLAEYGITPSALHPPRAPDTPADLNYYAAYYRRLLESGVSHLQIAAESWPVIVRHGWEDIAYAYCGSEWPREQNPHYAQVIREVVEQMPGVRPAVAGPEPDDYLKGLVKVWIYRSDFPLDSLRERVRQGEEAWWYTCCGPEPPYANVKLDSEPTAPRVLGWQLFQYGLTGFYYWRATMTGYADKTNYAGNSAQDKWPNRPWSTRTSDVPDSPNDGTLLYPGPDGVPWSSIRLENLRDGADDYDYLCLLRDYVAKLKKADLAPVLVERAEQALKVNPALSACLTEFTRNPVVIEAERRRIGAYLEEARVALGEVWPA